MPLAGWRSGPLYPDLSHKSSYPAFQQAIGSAVGHTVDCASLKGGLPSSDYLPPSTPDNVVATSSRNPLAVNVTWNAAVDTQSPVTYRIYRGGTQVGTSTTDAFTDGTVAGNRTYSYTVRAIDSASNLGAASTAASVTTPDVTPPAAHRRRCRRSHRTAASRSPGAATTTSVSRATSQPGRRRDRDRRDDLLHRFGRSGHPRLLPRRPRRSGEPERAGYRLGNGRRAASPPPAGGGGGSTPNLGVAVSASAVVVAAGGEVDLRATVSNGGDAGSLQTHLTIQLPAGVALLAPPAYERGSGCEGTTAIDCFLDYIPAGGETTSTSTSR